MEFLSLQEKKKWWDGDKIFACSSAAEHREGWLLNWQLKMHNLILITVSVVYYDEKKFIPSSFIKVIGRVEVGTELDNEFDSWAHILFWLGDHFYSRSWQILAFK